MNLLDLLPWRARAGDVGDWCPEDEYLDDVPTGILFPTLLAAPSTSLVVEGRVQWDKVLAGVPGVVYVDGWRERGRAVMNPVANLWHWTAGKPTAKRPAPSLGICIDGRPDVPGPLVHGHIALDGTIRVIASGRANHAGPGHRELIASTFRPGLPPKGGAATLGLADTGGSGGALIGWEIENDGKAPLDWRQVVAVARIGRATADRLGFNEAQAVRYHHRVWTRRKVDLSDAQMLRILNLYRSDHPSVRRP